MILTRIAKRKHYTIGKLFIAPSPLPLWGSATEAPSKPPLGETSCSDALEALPQRGSGEGAFLCDTLEPTWRDYEHGAYKIKGRSAIPEGRYAVVISFSPKFRKWLPILLGGPEFNKRWQGIRIHAGNSAKDTQGCILVGENREAGKLLDSNLWLHRLKHRIVEAKARGEAVWLTIQ
jgi:hypothetical protein